MMLTLQVLSILTLLTANFAQGLKLTSLGSTFDTFDTYDAFDTFKTDETSENVETVVEVLPESSSSVGCDECTSSTAADGADDADGSSSTSYSSSTSSSASSCESYYGVDASFPTHHSFAPWDENRSGQFGPFDKAERIQFYNKFMEGCRSSLPLSDNYLCDESEALRIKSNLLQPATMRNYTSLGFQKVATPPKLKTLLSKFFWANAGGFAHPNPYTPGSTIVNHWEGGAKTMDLGRNPYFEGGNGGGGRRGIPGSEYLRTQIYDATLPILQSFSNTSLSPSALYGIQIYSHGAIIPPHVNSLPFVISAVITVAHSYNNANSQKVGNVGKESWEWELIGHDGRAYNVSVDEGEMLLIEGGSVIHGRPFAMEGFIYADLAVHFEPVGYSLQHEKEQKRKASIDYAQSTRDSIISQNIDSAQSTKSSQTTESIRMTATNIEEQQLENLYQQVLSASWKNQALDSSRETLEKDVAGVSSLSALSGVPKYLERRPLDAARWKQTHPRAKLNMAGSVYFSVSAHTAASLGDLDTLKLIESQTPGSIQKVDENGWTPLHEAIRGGNIEVIEYLLKQGLDINHRTHGGTGGSPLWWAKQLLGKKHKVVKLLEGRGALDIAPED